MGGRRGRKILARNRKKVPGSRLAGLLPKGIFEAFGLRGRERGGRGLVCLRIGQKALRVGEYVKKVLIRPQDCLPRPVRLPLREIAFG